MNKEPLDKKIFDNVEGMSNSGYIYVEDLEETLKELKEDFENSFNQNHLINSVIDKHFGSLADDTPISVQEGGVQGGDERARTCESRRQGDTTSKDVNTNAQSPRAINGDGSLPSGYIPIERIEEILDNLKSHGISRDFKYDFINRTELKQKLREEVEKLQKQNENNQTTQ